MARPRKHIDPASMTRQERAKVNYQRLKDAGFSAKEAQRFRYATEENILKALAEKTLPEIRQEKRGAVKLKPVKQNDYKKISQRSILIDDFSSHYMKQVYKEVKRSLGAGYRYYSCTMEFEATSSNDKGVMGTEMRPIPDLKDYQELLADIQSMLDGLMERYKMEAEQLKITVILNLWKPLPRRDNG